MGTTPLGLVYPDDTDPVTGPSDNGATQMQALAESVDDLLGLVLQSRVFTPEAGVTTADEFDDVSLAGSWARLDVSGGSSRAVWTEDAGVLSLKLNGGDSAGETHSMLRSYALANGEYIQTRLTLASQPASYPFAGLVIADGNTYTSGNQIVWLMWNRGDGRNMTDGTWTGFNTLGTVSDRVLLWGLQYHLRIKRTGTSTWEFSISPDGVSWAVIATPTLSLTPSHVGLIGGTYGSSVQAVASFDYFRIGS